MDAPELAAWRNRRRYRRSAWGRPRMPIHPGTHTSTGETMSDRIASTMASAFAAAGGSHSRYGDLALAQIALDALKANRIAVVELPVSYEDEDGQVYYGADGGIRVDTTARGTDFPLIYVDHTPYAPETLRRDAAEMLAAALEAEK
ncbi:hypothetical protein SEA_PHALM_56 [Mycobacterium phage Phalm]|nr:hypothetical protein SEA_PHALM_56 [Mycobacterium phage Phalm]QHB41479.1 hypothetical protein SEA_GLASKE_55 [Mycobacterium phage Glaske]QIG57649.1 hypothetical protein SEA_STRESSBALL_56 [Mycobacterium phage StressBall]